MILRRLAGGGESYGAVIRGPAYVPLWLAQLVSSFGDTLHYIALDIPVYELTGQGAAAAVLVAVEVVPILLLAPVAGVIIDRFSRKAVLHRPDEAIAAQHRARWTARRRMSRRIGNAPVAPFVASHRIASISTGDPI